MSVVKSKQTEGKLLVVTKARELAAYTIKICSNEKNFPKRYRWCITAKIVDFNEETKKISLSVKALEIEKRNEVADVEDSEEE